MTLEAQRQERVKMAERHVRVALAFQAKAVERLQSIDADKLTPDQTLRWFEAAVRIERLARGEPSERERHDVLSDEALMDECARLAKQLSIVRQQVVTPEQVMAEYKIALRDLELALPPKRRRT
jgi:hypothetical protein